MSFAGKVAVVTGAARGLGRAYALRLAQLGADVAVIDINLSGANEFGEELTAATVPLEIEKLGRRSLGVEADLTQEAAVRDAFAQIQAHMGRVDILVNNAGGAITPVERSLASQFPQEDYDRIFDVNLRSTILCCQAAVPLMKASGGGAIVNTASMAALLPANRNGIISAYGVAKAAVIQYTRYLAVEVGQYGIRVNCLSPGSISTARILATAKARGIQNPAEIEGIPLRRFGKPEDCAGVVEFLTSDLSAYVTGQCISVCGGRVAVPS